jgi:hypothetical protein
LASEVRVEPFQAHGYPTGFRVAPGARSYEAYAAALDETIDATLGIFSACGDLRSHPARSQDSGTENSE